MLALCLLFYHQTLGSTLGHHPHLQTTEKQVPSERGTARAVLQALLYRTAPEHQGRVTRRAASQVLALGPIRAGAVAPPEWVALDDTRFTSGGLCQPMLSSD